MKEIYIIPGRGQEIINYSVFLSELGFNISGREIYKPPFSNSSFSDQISILSNDIKQSAWYKFGVIVSFSYGSYLLLQTLMSEDDPYPGKVLLVSPVLGAMKRSFLSSTPPRAEKLRLAMQTNIFPAPDYSEILIGQYDACLDLAKAFSNTLNSRLLIIPDQGHRLDYDTVCKAITEFLRYERD